MASIFKKNITYLISGLLFLVYGFYRLFQFYTEDLFNPVRLIIALALLGYGGYTVYTYFKYLKENKPK